jgi:hypothetical protein
MKTSDKLIAMLAGIGIGPDRPQPLRFVRLHPGYLAREDGAWSWMVLDAMGGEVVGSTYSVESLLRAGRVGAVKVYRNPWCDTELIIEGEEADRKPRSHERKRVCTEKLNVVADAIRREMAAHEAMGKS